MANYSRTLILALSLFFCAFQVHSQRSWPPGNTALILIDIQEFYFPGGFSELQGTEEAADNAALLLEFFRTKNWPVVHIGHNAKEQQDFYPSVSPDEGEFILMKSEVNAFYNGELQDHLKVAGITHLIICGMQTHMCVEAATRAASDLGYEVTLVRDACATKDLNYLGNVIPAQEVHYSTLATLSNTYATIVDAASLIAELKLVE